MRNGTSTANKEPAAAVQTKENGWGMLDQERLVFGDRCPKGFQKLGILGKGGIAVVWLCLNVEKQLKVALKQFPKKSSHTKGLDHSAKVEIQAAEAIFDSNI
jgi:serine/threonine protein kinase